MNKPVNQIGWWTKEGNVYADGTAYLNGEAVSDQDRVLILRLYGELPEAAPEESAEETPAAEEPAEAQPNPQTADAGMAMYAWLAVVALLILTAAGWMRRSRTN
jgi:LPXTG-motif cell wall-anchored protein